MPPNFANLRSFGRFALPVIFLLLIPACVVVASLMPTGEQPDEPAHILRADSLLHGEVLGHREPRPNSPAPFAAGETVNRGLLNASITFPPEPLALKKVTPAIDSRLDSVRWDGSLHFVETPNTAVYFPLFYVPSSIGIGVAHVAGFGPHAAIIAARMADVVVYAAMGVFALLLAERAQLAIFVALALPMSLSLAASVCPDGMLIATTALSVAALTRTGPEQSWTRPLAWVGIAAIIATKIPYFPLALCTLAPLPLRGWTWRQVGRAAIQALLVALPGLTWTVVSIAIVSVPFVKGPPYHPGPLWPGNPSILFPTTNMGAQLTVLLHQPRLVAALPIRSLMANWNNYLESMIGILGLLNVVLPDWSYDLWECALVAAIASELFRSRDALRTVRGGGAIVISMAIVASVFAIFMAQYLSWTDVGAALIDGVQGRYFLPLIPFVGLIVPPLGDGRTDLFRWFLAGPALAAAMVGTELVPKMILTTFYLH